MNIRKIGIIVGVIALLAVAGAFGVKWKFETDVRNNIESFFAALPQPMSVKAEKIDVSFFDKSVTLTNVASSYVMHIRTGEKEEALPITGTAARVIAKGVNIDGFNPGAGTVKLLDQLVFENFVTDIPMAKTQVERYEFNNISADFSLVVTEFKKGIPILIASSDNPQEFLDAEVLKKTMRAVADILKATETIHIGSESFTNYAYSLDIDGENMDMLVKSGKAQDYSIRKIHSNTMNDVTFSFAGKQVAVIGNLSSDEIILPSFVKIFEVLAEDPMPHMVQDALKGQPFAIKNLRLKNLRITHVITQAPLFALGDITVNYAAEDLHRMNFAVNGLDINKSLLVETLGAPADVLASLPDTITFEGVIDQTIAIKEGYVFDLDCKKIFVKGTGLGEAALSFAVNNINVMASMMGMPNTSALQHFDAKVSDQGFTNVFFALDAHHSDITPEESRTTEVESLRNQLAADPDQPGKEILAGLANFLEQPGGTLHIAAKPEQPGTIEQLLQAYLQNPASLGLSVIFTPGK